MIPNINVKVLGDTHLGRTFTKGVPLDRRGERERLLLSDFKAALQVGPHTQVHIHMGDLFDKPQVPYSVLRDASCVYKDAASNHPNCMFYILQGNHDDSRDLDEVTAWDIFQILVAHSPNIDCVTHPKIGVGGVLLLPWHPTNTAVEQLEAIFPGEHSGAAFGHWDTEIRFGGHNLIPTAELAEIGITHTLTGHIHKPDAFVRDGVSVTIVGSMQPLAQGEDGGQCPHVSYLTVEPTRLEELVLRNPSLVERSCIRLQLQPGEDWDGVIPPCRSWDVQRLRAVEEQAPADVSTEGFDATTAYTKSMDSRTIIPPVREQLDAKWASISTSED